MDNSVDPPSQSTAHGQACSVIVERVDMADCESTSSVFFLRLAAATFATISDVRVKEEIPADSAVFPVFETIVDISGFFRIFPGRKSSKTPR